MVKPGVIETISNFEDSHDNIQKPILDAEMSHTAGLSVSPYSTPKKSISPNPAVSE